MQVFAEPLERRYRASVCSWGALCNVILWVIVVVIPYIWAYTSNSFWLKQSVYREQAAVSFNHKLLVKLDVMDTDLETGHSALLWSTEAEINAAAGSRYRPSRVLAGYTDDNGDAVADVFNITLDFPITATESVVGAQVIAFFDYSLSERAQIQMETLAIFQGSHALPSSRLTIDGTLDMDQRSLLWTNGGVAVLYDDEPLLDTDGFSSLRDVFPSVVIDAYSQRNFTTRFDVPYPVWTIAPPSAGSGNAHFVIEMIVRNTVQSIEYIPNLAEMLKFAWMQYLALFIILYYLIHLVKLLIYPNQVFESEVLIDQGAYRGPKQHNF